jgi:2-C-methyl-D-erythritol 4-phosphate cytidylyltransferase
VAMIEGLPQNLKITTPDDLKRARAWMGGARKA